jgi:acetylornithine deacetylase/succinyl-diaminopimelate desuccinylase-like protein
VRRGGRGVGLIVTTKLGISSTWLLRARHNLTTASTRPYVGKMISSIPTTRQLHRRTRRLLAATWLVIAGTRVSAQPSIISPERAAARAWRQQHEGAILTEFAELIAIPNLASDSANIRRNADFLLAMLEKRGFTNRKMLTLPGVPPAVYAELPAPGATRTLILYAHYDGQPVDPKQWTNPPWSPVLRTAEVKAGGKLIPIPTGNGTVDPESRIYGRGSGDDKSSIMAILAAVDAMHASKIAATVNLKVFFEGEEEAGSAHLEQMLTTYKTQLSGDGWLFCDSPVHQSGQQQLIFGQRGTMGLELTVYGPTRALHSGHYGNWAPNPGAMIANLIASMRDDDGKIKIASYYDDVKPVTAAERAALAKLPKVDSMLKLSFGLGRSEANNAGLADRLMLPALNVRGIRVGGVRETGSNTIAQEAFASFDFRFVPGEDPARVRKLVEAHLVKQGYWITHDSVTVAMRIAHPKIVRVEWQGGYPAQRVPMDGPYGQAVLETLSRGVASAPLVVPTMGGSGPAYLFEQVLKTPIITLPIANYDDNQHAADENMRVKNLWDGIETFVAVISGMGKAWGERVVP